MANVTVLGAGAWGTAFGQVLADAGNDVTMWAIEPEIVENIKTKHCNPDRLPNVKVLPDNITAESDRAKAVEKGVVNTLVIGGKKVGTNSWKIKSVSEAWDCVLQQGQLVRAKLNVTMEEYL